MYFTAIMRSFSLLQEAIVPYIPTLIGQLTQKLLLVSKVTKSLEYRAKDTSKGCFQSDSPCLQLWQRTHRQDTD